MDLDHISESLLVNAAFHSTKSAHHRVHYLILLSNKAMPVLTLRFCAEKAQLVLESNDPEIQGISGQFPRVQQKLLVHGSDLRALFPHA